MWSCKFCSINFINESIEQHLYENHLKLKLAGESGQRGGIPIKVYSCGNCSFTTAGVGGGFESMAKHCLKTDHPPTRVSMATDEDLRDYFRRLFTELEEVMSGEDDDEEEENISRTGQMIIESESSSNLNHHRTSESSSNFKHQTSKSSSNLVHHRISESSSTLDDIEMNKDIVVSPKINDNKAETSGGDGKTDNNKPDKLSEMIKKRHDNFDENNSMIEWKAQNDARIAAKDCSKVFIDESWITVTKQEDSSGSKNTLSPENDLKSEPTSSPPTISAKHRKIESALDTPSLHDASLSSFKSSQNQKIGKPKASENPLTFIQPPKTTTLPSGQVRRMRSKVDRLALAKRDQYTCGECPKVFYTTQAIRNHENSHRTQRPTVHPCPDCGHPFKTKSQLTQHFQRVHRQGERPYRCRFCGKCFSTSRTFETHIRIHTAGIKPFVCFECDMAFAEQLDYNEHLQGHRAAATKPAFAHQEHQKEQRGPGGPKTDDQPTIDGNNEMELEKTLKDLSSHPHRTNH